MPKKKSAKGKQQTETTKPAKKKLRIQDIYQDKGNRLKILKWLAVVIPLVLIIVIAVNFATFRGWFENEEQPGAVQDSCEIDEATGQYKDVKCNVITLRDFRNSNGRLNVASSTVQPCDIMYNGLIYRISKNSQFDDWNYPGDGNIKSQCGQNADSFLFNENVEVPERYLIGRPNWDL